MDRAERCKVKSKPAGREVLGEVNLHGALEAGIWQREASRNSPRGQRQGQELEGKWAGWCLEADHLAEERAGFSVNSDIYPAPIFLVHWGRIGASSWYLTAGPEAR